MSAHPGPDPGHAQRIRLHPAHNGIRTWARVRNRSSTRMVNSPAESHGHRQAPVHWPAAGPGPPDQRLCLKNAFAAGSSVTWNFPHKLPLHLDSLMPGMGAQFLVGGSFNPNQGEEASRGWKPGSAN